MNLNYKFVIFRVIIYSSDLESHSFIQQNLSLSTFESGLYFVKIFDNNNNYLVKKLNVVK